MSKLTRAIARLDATRLLDGDYAYFAEEVGDWYRVTEQELEDLGEILADPDCGADPYSLWCTGSGELLTISEVQELGLIPVQQAR